MRQLPADYAACADDDCPSKYRCIRHFASGAIPARDRQVFSDHERPKDALFCKDFIDKSELTRTARADA